MVLPARLHALIIGINNYSKVPKLRGAVSDALRFEEYLLNSRHVPSTNIKRLMDAAATRTAIIAALRSFQTDETVEKDKTAIIVFFAGHGASSAVPADWPAWSASGGKAEQLCPVDIGEMNDEGMLIEGIPDYTIRVLLDDLSKAKGNNITLIMDCCHSGGMNRDLVATGGRVARSIDNPPPLSGLFDLDICSSQNRSAHVAEGFSGTGRESHILLAACSRNQSAYEKEGHGLFTTAVLEVLSQPGSEQLTYASLMHRIVMPYSASAPQTPHCEGTYMRRRLFDSWSAEGDAAVVLCHREGAATSFTLEAGSMHGVAVGNQYTIFDSDILNESSYYVTATVERVDAFTSVLVPFGASDKQNSLPRSDDSVKELRYARLKKETAILLHVYCSDDQYIQQLLVGVGSIIAVTEPTEADLVLTLTNGKVFFERGPKAPIIAPHIEFPTALSGTVAINAREQARHAIRSYARFLHHLRRTAPSSDSQRLLGFSLKRLKTVSMKVEPFGEELLDENSDLVTVTADDSFYGLELTNRTNMRLFVHVFWFDPSTSEIVLWYDPCQGSGQTDAPGARLLDTELEPGKVLSAGFGNGGVHPFYFELGDRSIDVSLLKIFVATTPTDMRWLEQLSPFDGQRKACLEAWEDEDKEEDLWMTKTITVVQKADA